MLVMIRARRRQAPPGGQLGCGRSPRQASFSIGHADIVAVDAEGLDALIVTDVLKAGLQPLVLLFEHKHLSQAARQTLLRLLRENCTVIEGPYDTLCTRNGSSAEQTILRHEWSHSP